MRRKKTLVAVGTAARVKLTIEVASAPGHLVRDEVSMLTDSLTSDAMQLVANRRYLNVPLSEVRVR